MTQHEATVISAYTGYLFVPFDALHKYVEEKLGRSVFTHEMTGDFYERLREAVLPDLLELDFGFEDDAKLAAMERHAKGGQTDEHT